MDKSQALEIAATAQLSEGDMRRVQQSADWGYGYLKSDFDEPLAADLSAVLCHLKKSADAPTPARYTYHLDMAAGYARMALARI
jgi:hypothetical protein